MIAPKVTSQIEEPRDLARALIYRGNVSAFVPIADRTGKRQTLAGRFTTVLATDNVIYWMREATSSSWIRQYSQRPPARRATSARSASLMSLATREDVAGPRLGHSQNML